MTDKNEKSAAQEIFDLLDDGAYEIPDDLYEKALKDGFSKHFSFHIATADYGDETPELVTLIYPRDKDSTWRGAALVRPMLPEGDSVDECMEDYWSFEGFDTPAKIAGLLHSRGFAFDEESQNMRNPELTAEIKAALAPAAAPVPAATVKANKPQGPRP